MTDHIISSQKCKKIENEISEHFKERNPIADGIVDIQTYCQSKFRILWILKEAHEGKKEGEAGEGNWSLIDFSNLTDFYDTSRSTWHPIIYVSYSILNGFKDYNSMKDIRNEPSMANTIKNIAIINVNKLPGYTRSNYKNIANAYTDNKSVLLKQIETYNPNIVIGGSTMHLFYDDLGLKDKIVEMSKNVYYTIKEQRIYIDAYHPAQRRISRKQYVDEIVNVVKECGQNFGFLPTS